MEEFDIRRMLDTIWQKKEILGAIIGITIVIGILYTFILKQPLYKSTSKLLLEKNELSANEFIKSDTVLEEVRNNLAVQGLTIDILKKDITSSYTKETKVIEINCISDNAEFSNQVVKELTSVYTRKLGEVLGMKNTKILQESRQANSPYNVHHTKDLLIALAVGIVICGAYLFFLSVFDNSIRRKEEIESLGLRVLGVVPEKEEK